MAMNHARETEAHLEIACERDGTIIGLRGEVHADMGAYMRTNGAVGARNVVQFMGGPYRVPHIKLDFAPVDVEQDAGRPLSRTGAVRVRASTSSGCSTWWRATSRSTAWNCAAATW